MHLTEVERAILDFVAKENPDPELIAQIESLEVASREHTGVGLYTNFEFRNRDYARRISSPRVPYPGPNLNSPDLEHGAGSVVWCGDDGFLSCIEIFSYSDQYPEGDFDFSIMSDGMPKTNQAEQVSGGNGG